MGTTLTLELPDDLARRARALATATNRRFEEAIVEWISRAVADPDVESATDDELLALCDLTLDDVRQETLTDLLGRLREGELSPADRLRLDDLMSVYRQGLVLKARAMAEAVSRGLKPRLADDAA